MGPRTAHISVANDAAEMLRVAVWLEECAATLELPDATLQRIDLVLNEALPNIFAYAYTASGRHQIDITLRDEPGCLWLEIVDDGVAFDPLARAPYHEADTLEHAAANGRGIHLIRSFSDQQYERTGDQNRLRVGFVTAAGAMRPTVA